MNASFTSHNKRRKENCTGRYSGGLRKKNGERLVNLCESNTAVYSELARNLFPVESTNNIKIEKTYQRVIGDGCIWEGMSL